LAQDLDLCRDPNLVDVDEETGEASGQVWRCPECKHPYDRTLLEQQLVETAQRMSMKYQVQDLRCKKTLQVEAEMMAEYSAGANKLECEMKSTDVLTFMRTLLNVAKYHQFPWLEESIEWIMEANV
jgi:hypothetical protein